MIGDCAAYRKEVKPDSKCTERRYATCGVVVLIVVRAAAAASGAIDYAGKLGIDRPIPPPFPRWRPVYSAQLLAAREAEAGESDSEKCERSWFWDAALYVHVGRVACQEGSCQAEKSTK